MLNDFGDAHSALHALYPEACNLYDGRITYTVCSGSALPAPYFGLLAHEEHMTTKLSAHYGVSVGLTVLEVRRDGPVYTRRIVLKPVGSERVVEFGVVRIHLDMMDPAVRQAIEAQGAPLGDILIRHDVLRRIEPLWFLRFEILSPVLAHFAENRPGEAYGRIGVIHCNDRPAIQLLEVVADRQRGGTA